MSEAAMVSTLVQRLGPLDPQRIESPRTGIGIPDINITYGWIECKALKSWPKNADTQPVKFPHALSKEQQVWLYRRERAGGLALVCGKVSNTWFFWSGKTIKELDLWDNMTRPQMHHHALRTFTKGLDGRQLQGFLHSEWMNLQQANIF